MKYVISSRIDEISTIFKECEPVGGKLRSVEVCQEKYAKV